MLGQLMPSHLQKKKITTNRLAETVRVGICLAATSEMATRQRKPFPTKQALLLRIRTRNESYRIHQTEGAPFPKAGGCRFRIFRHLHEVLMTPSC